MQRYVFLLFAYFSFIKHKMHTNCNMLGAFPGDRELQFMIKTFSQKTKQKIVHCMTVCTYEKRFVICMQSKKTINQAFYSGGGIFRCPILHESICLLFTKPALRFLLPSLAINLYIHKSWSFFSVIFQLDKQVSLYSQPPKQLWSSIQIK